MMMSRPHTFFPFLVFIWLLRVWKHLFGVKQEEDEGTNVVFWVSGSVLVSGWNKMNDSTSRRDSWTQGQHCCS